MDNFDLRNLQLSYQAVYDETLCESMEELGLIDEARDGYGDDSKFKGDTDADDFVPGKTVPKVKKYGRLSRFAPEALSGERSRTSSNVRRTTTAPNTPRSVQIPREERKPKMVKKDGKWVKEAYELILSYLLDEGYADSLGAAEIILENMSEEWLDELLDEAEGSYGMTPKSYERYSTRARQVGQGKNRRKASDLARRARNTDPRPNPPGYRKGMTPDDRAYFRRDSEDGDYDYEQSDKPSRPGGMPKGKKLARQKATGVSEAYGLILSYLLDEGYADSLGAAEIILENMSEEWLDEVLEEGYKKLPVGKMMKQAARKVYKAADSFKTLDGKVTIAGEPNWMIRRALKQANKMSRVADRHSTVKGKGRVRGEGQAELNRRRGENK